MDEGFRVLTNHEFGYLPPEEFEDEQSAVEHVCDWIREQNIEPDVILSHFGGLHRSVRIEGVEVAKVVKIGPVSFNDLGI